MFGSYSWAFAERTFETFRFQLWTVSYAINHISVFGRVCPLPDPIRDRAS